MAVLAVKEINGGGVNAGLVAAGATGDSFPVSTDERTFLHVKNASASPCVVTVAPVTLTERVAGAGAAVPVPSLTMTVPVTTGDMYLGPFPRDYIGANGQVQVSYSAVTTVTVEVLHMAFAA